jgi:hypothetical protein|tara:strand:- start:5713 stop:7371 length:1659 start_codon:yes stop_codon:yes gene_type:complete
MTHAATFVVFLCMAFIGAPFPAAAETVTLPPAKYKPLPIGTKVKFDNRSFEVTKTDGFLTVFKARSEGVNSWLGKSKRSEGWMRAYGLFGEFTQNMHVFDTRGDLITYEIDGDEREKLKSLWPLEVGKKTSFELKEGGGECTDPDEWQITLEVTKSEVIAIKGIDYPVYVIEERGKSSSGKIYKGRRWYQPAAGIVIKAERDWVKSFQVRPMMADAGGGFGGGLGGGFGGGFGGFGPGSMCMGTNYVKEPLFGEGEEDNYSLVRVTYPEGTTTHALKGTKEGGQAEALLAEVRGLKKEVEVASRGLAGKPAIDIKGVDFGQYHALVIGINKYKHLPKLETAVRDAKAVAQVLEKDYGFKVRLLVNPDRQGIIDSLDEFRESLGGKDNLLIYYAGHGWLDEDADRGYWLPSDAQSNRRSRWVSNATITDTLRTLQAKHVMVVADSCYSGTLTRSANIGLRAGDYYKRMAKKWARVAMVSGGLEPVADKGGGGHSPFAKAFIEALNNNDSVIDGTQLYSNLRRPVMVAADQTPQYSDVRNAGHDGGDFMFVKKK